MHFYSRYLTPQVQSFVAPDLNKLFNREFHRFPQGEEEYFPLRETLRLSSAFTLRQVAFKNFLLLRAFNELSVTFLHNRTP